MGLEQNNEQHYREVVDKYANPFVDYQMTTRDYILRPYTVGEAITITLPPVAEAKGRFYSIVAGDITGAFYITVQNGDDSEGWEGDMTLSASGQAMTLYSDGRRWMLRTFNKITVDGYSHNAITVGPAETGVSLDGVMTTGISFEGAMTTGIQLINSYSSAGIAVGREGTELVVQAAAPLIEVHGTSALTTGTYDAVEIRFTQTAAIQTGYVKALRVHAVSDVKTPGSFNAGYFKLDYVTDGYPWGDCAPISSELVMPNNAAIPRGLFTAAELQIAGGAASAFGGGGPLSFIHCNMIGTVAFVDANAYFVDFGGLTIGDANMVRTNTTTATHGIRILIDGVRYDLLCSAAHA